METEKLLFEQRAKSTPDHGQAKVTVVGVGQVGMACAFHLIATVSHSSETLYVGNRFLLLLIDV